MVCVAFSRGLGEVLLTRESSPWLEISQVELIGCRRSCYSCPPLAPLRRPPCLPILLLSLCYFYPFIFSWYWLKACNLLHLELHLLKLRSKKHAKVHPRRTYHLCRKYFRVFQVNINHVPDAQVLQVDGSGTCHSCLQRQGLASSCAVAVLITLPTS